MRELKKMRIENVNVFTEDGVFRKGAVVFDEAIRKVEIDPDPGQDTGLYLIPGLIDIHTHGAVNGDHSDGSREAMHDMARFYIENGVTSFLATGKKEDANANKARIFPQILRQDLYYPIKVHFLSSARHFRQRSDGRCNPECFLP